MATGLSSTTQPQPALDGRARAVNTEFLDGMRGLAALYVVISHASYFLYRGYLVQMQSFGKVEPTAGLDRAVLQFMRCFQYGYVAVVFFFVLSGFVIHLRYAQALANDPASARFQWFPYVKRRARCLYPPLIFALVVSAILAVIGLKMGSPIYRDATIYSWVNGKCIPELGWKTLLGNLTFVMFIYVPVYGANGPLWSLTYEWWFYMLYPALWWMSRRSIVLATVFVGAMFALSFMPAIWPCELARSVFSLLPAWWYGALLADVFTRRIRISFAWLVPPVVLFGVFQIRSLPHELKTAIEGLGAVGLFSLFFWLASRGWKLRALSRLKFLGDMSYTLYTVHMPLLIFLAGVMVFKTPSSQLPRSVLPMMEGIVAAVLVAWLAHFVVEVPFTRRRHKVVAPIAPSSTESALASERL